MDSTLAGASNTKEKIIFVTQDINKIKAAETIISVGVYGKSLKSERKNVDIQKKYKT